MTVHQIAVRPWRFDDARNAAMALISGPCGHLLHDGHEYVLRARLEAEARSGMDRGDSCALLSNGNPMERRGSDADTRLSSEKFSSSLGVCLRRLFIKR